MNARSKPKSMPVGAIIAERRNARGLTLRQLKARIGLSVPFLSDIERGRRRLSDNAAKKIGAALGLKLTGEHCGRATQEVRL